MQPLIRVFLVAENDTDTRKLRQFFEEFPGFAVVDTLPTVGLEPGDFDIRVVHGKKLADLPLRAQMQVPTLYLVPHGALPRGELRVPNAVLPPDAPAAQIRAAAMAVVAGLQIARKNNLEAEDNESDFSFVELLTDRELHVLNLMADGYSNPDIAHRLGISRNTVKFHVSSIISKLGATSRTEAVTIGIKRGLIIL